MRLSHIHIKLKTASGTVEDFFSASILGETVARQRAASRVAAMKAGGAQIVNYTEHFEDGTTRELFTPGEIKT